MWWGGSDGEDCFVFSCAITERMAFLNFALAVLLTSFFTGAVVGVAVAVAAVFDEDGCAERTGAGDADRELEGVANVSLGTGIVVVTAWDRSGGVGRVNVVIGV